MHKIIQIVNNLDDFTIKEPYQTAIPGVFHGALYEKARAGRNGRPFLLAHATRVAAGRKRAAIDFATIFRSQNLASAR
jgi:hypothetical protein